MARGLASESLVDVEQRDRASLVDPDSYYNGRLMRGAIIATVLLVQPPSHGPSHGRSMTGLPMTTCAIAGFWIPLAAPKSKMLSLTAWKVAISVRGSRLSIASATRRAHAGAASGRHQRRAQE